MPQAPRVDDFARSIGAIPIDDFAQSIGATAEAPTVAPALDLTKMRPSELVRSGASHRDIAEELRRRERERTSAGASIVPMVLGGVGGMMGGIPGAAIGGAVGKAVEQSVLRGQGDPSVPADVMGQAAAMGKEGAVQGVMQGAGQALAAGGSAAAKWLMNRATTRVSAKLARDFPELSQTLIDNAIAVSKGGEAKARVLLQNAKGAASKALNAADAAGKTVPVEMTPELAESFKTALVERAVKSGSTRGVPAQHVLTDVSKRLNPELTALIGQIDDAAKAGETVALTPLQADALKTQLQKESRALYANRVAPNGPAALSQQATSKAEFASRLNDVLDDLANGYKAANKEAQQMLGAMRGVQQARRPSGNLYQALVRPAVGGMLGAEAGRRQSGTPGAVAGGIAGAVLASPQGMSREAILLGNPIMQSILSQLPRASQAALIGLLSPQPDTPETPQGSGR